MRIFLATPIRGLIEPEYLNSICSIQSNPPCEMIVHRAVGGDPVHVARNKIVSLFMKSSATHLLWADSDQVFTSDNIKKLISHDVDFVGASICRKKPDELHWCFRPLSIDGEPFLKANENGLMPVDAIGCGLTLVTGVVYEKMIEHYGESTSYLNEDETETLHELYKFGLYDHPDGKRTSMGEDFYFSARWKSIGGEIHADTKLVVGHIGTVVFPIKEQVTYNK